jgi:hypothetical protein
MVEMMENRTFVAHRSASSLLCLAILVGVSQVAVAGDKLPFKVTTRRDDDKVETKFTAGKAVLSIHSPTGISSATIVRTAATWPNIVLLRLRLQGLESFQASNHDVTLHASVSSHADGRVRLWIDDNENEPLGSDSVYWMRIRIVGSDGKPAAPPRKNGYFEMQLPQALFRGNPQSIKLKWIDFYRN